jgi:hypothetical protein
MYPVEIIGTKPSVPASFTNQRLFSVLRSNKLLCPADWSLSTLKKEKHVLGAFLCYFTLLTGAMIYFRSAPCPLCIKHS